MEAVRWFAHRAKAFYEFAAGTFLSLLDAFTRDIEVFLLGVSAILLSFDATRAFGVVLLVYVILRRGNEWVSAVVRASKDGDSSG